MSQSPVVPSTMSVWTGRKEHGWRREWQAAKDSWRGLWAFVLSCRPLCYQTAAYVITATAGVILGFGLRSWLIFVVMVGLGFLAEAINTLGEAIGTKLARMAWMFELIIQGQTSRLLRPDGSVIPDHEMDQKYDESVRMIKDLAAGLVFWIFAVDFVLGMLITIFPH